MVKTKFIITLFSFLLTVNCGYKIINQSSANNFQFSEILTSGDPRINYNIKNQLFAKSSKTSENIIFLDIKTEKRKTVKNKNIKNEITDYEIIIISEISYKILNINKEDRFNISKSGVYKVSDQRLNTTNNEKNLLNLLTNNITNQLLSKINQELNDN